MANASSSKPAEPTQPGSGERPTDGEGAGKSIAPEERYELLDIAQERRYGDVYEAKDVETGDKCLLAMTTTEFASDKNAVRAYRAASRVAGQLGSKHIVSVENTYDLADGGVVLVTSYVPGVRLAAELKHGPITPSRTIAILRQIAQGLGEAHAVGIIHGALLPESVILTERDGRADHVKLTDFGVASLLESGPASTVSRIRIPVTPEGVLEGDRDIRQDMYLLGCLAYEMLSGRPPFGDARGKELRKRCATEDVPRLTGVKDVPPPLARFTQRCLRRSPADRFEEMPELEAYLCEAQIAAGIRTPWDDLPLDHVEDDRRKRIERGFARLSTRSEVASRMRGAQTGTPKPIGPQAGPAAASSAPTAPSDKPAPVQAKKPEVSSGPQTAVKEPVKAPSGTQAIVEQPAEPPKPSPSSPAAAKPRQPDEADAFEEAPTRLHEPERAKVPEPPDVDPDEDSIEVELSASQPQAVAKPKAAAEPSQGNWAKLGIGAGALVVLIGLTMAMIGDDPEPITDGKAVTVEPEKRGPARRERIQEQAPEPAKQDSRFKDGRLVVEIPDGKTAPRQAEPEGDTDTDGPEETTGAEDSSPVSDARTAVIRGLSALRKGNPNEAERQFREALKHDPRNYTATNKLADLYFQRGSYQKAVRHARKAVGLAPRNGGNVIRLGDVFFKLSRYKEAAEQYQRAKKLGHPAAAKRLEKVQKKLE